MKVNFVSYADTDTNWNLEKVVFKNLTLLVGASGVGKTQILQTLLRLKSISRGESISGTKWDIEFTTINKDVYRWSGEYERKGKSILSYGELENGEKKTFLLF